MNDINAAAQELVRDQPIIIPIAGDFTIVQMTRLTPTTIDYKVFSHRHHVAAVRFTFDVSGTLREAPKVSIMADAFNHNAATSEHLRQFVNALYAAACDSSNPEAIKDLRDSHVTYWGNDPIEL
jgi:hypothetical protein